MLADHAVCLVDLEMGRRETLERFRQLGATDELISEQLIYLEPSEPMTEAEILVDVRALLETRRPSLIGIDAFSGALALHGLDENSNRDVESFYRTVVDELRAHGAAVVILDHLTKNPEARGKYAIGAGRKIGATDVHLRFEVIQPFGRGKTGKAKLETKKDRPGHLARPKAAELELVSHPSGAIEWTLTIADDNQSTPFRPTGFMERVSLYIENCVDPPSHNTVDKAIKGNTDARRIAIDTLIAEGYIATEEGPRKAILLRSIKTYREADDTTSPTSPDLSSTSPGGEHDDFSHLSPTPVGGGSVGEVEVSQDEIERLAVLAETAFEEAL
jgi:hypothetical protein